MKKQAENWLNMADDDLRVIPRIIDDEELTNIVAFHAQQAVEKILKAVLEEYESHVPRIHNIIKLKSLAEKYIPFNVDRMLFEQINEVYADSRYPSEPGIIPDGKPSMKLAESFYEFAKTIRNIAADHFDY